MMVSCLKRFRQLKTLRLFVLMHYRMRNAARSIWYLPEIGRSECLSPDEVKF